MRWPRPGSGGSQEPALFPWLTALENGDRLEAAGIHPPLGVRGLDMLTLTGLSGRENQIPAELRWPETAGFARSGIGPIAARTAHGRTVRRSGRHHA
ncbi:MAG: hypothetical protein ACLSHC_12780 [Bilophila wadsworthia]